MAEGLTICARCIYLHADAKRDPHWRWMCTAAPLEMVNPVCGKIDPPYHFCRTINHGSCWMYQEGPNVLQPSEKKETV